MHTLIALISMLPLTSPQTLPSYSIPQASISISGFSSGGFMAAQLAIAYSATFPSGFGVFAGGPYDCARNQQNWEACMYNSTPAIELPTANIRQWSKEGVIDDVVNLKRRKVYLQAGMEDDVVGFGPVRQLEKQLEMFLEKPQQQVKFEALRGAAHAFPTDFDGEGNSACGENAGPYIANCGYDGAGAVLRWLYGKMNPRREIGKLGGKTLAFDQKDKLGANGLGQMGFIFVPKDCEDGRSCRLHVALHGCTQGYELIGLRYIENTGYREWADANDIVVLFPQATVDSTLHQLWNGSMGDNANGCFDWIGWTGQNADLKGGPQMQAMVNMVERLSSRGEEERLRSRDEI